MNKLSEIWGEIYSVIRAILRLIFLSVTMIASGLHIILFTRTEIYNVELKGMPLLCDREKIGDQISFVDSLMCNNPDLIEFADEQEKNNGDLPPDVDNGGEE